MQLNAFTLRRSTWAFAALGLLASACDRYGDVAAPRIAAPAEQMLSIEVSDSTLASGQLLAVSVANTSLAPIGGVQGYLRFDSSRLRYRGQVRDAGSSQLLLVNATAADRGELRLAVLDPVGLKHTGTLVFEVVGAGYASSLSLAVEEAGLNGSPVVLVQAGVDPVVSVNRTLSASPDARRLTVRDWQNVLSSQKSISLSRDPGEIRNGLKFGDTNFDTNLSLTDALYIINVSVALNEMIIGTDGTGPLGDRDAVVAGNVFPFNSPGLGEPGDAIPPGLETDGSRRLTLGDGLAIINESAGLDQPVVGDVIPGRPVAPASNRVIVSANVTTNTTWTSSNIYELSGGILVTNGATLTIEPGTLIEGQRGGTGLPGAALFVARDGRIIADGTPLQPIVMTCVGGPTPRFKGCWGGVVILGNASLNDGALTSPVIAGRAPTGGCFEKQGEGGAGLYGGCNDNDDSGILRYLRVEYGGFRFTPTNELNGIALSGVGRGTIVDYVQVHAGLDDGIEFFGGTVNVKHLYLTANSDDSFDYTEGYRGKAQFVIIQHDSLDSDKGVEADNNEFVFTALPRATPTLYNFTLIGKANPASTSGTAGNNSVGGLHIRRGTRPKLFNFLVQNFSFALDIDDAETCVNFGTDFELKSSVFTQNLRLDASDSGDPAACGATEVDAINLAGSNNQVIASSPILSALDVMVPDFRPAFGTATGAATPPNDGFFDPTATFIGAVAPATATKSNIPWYSGWTRGWQNPTTP